MTPWTAARQASLSFSSSQSLFKLISTESMMPSNHLLLCHHLLLLPSIFPSIKVFSSESALHIRWPKYCTFSFSISPSNEYSGLMSFRIDQFDLLAVQGTLKSFIQYHSSKASILQTVVQSHEIKRCLLLGRNAMTNLDSVLKSRDITLPTKVCIVISCVFSSSHVCWTIKKAEH